MEEEKEWLSVKEVAVRRGVTVQRVNQMIKGNRLPATRIGNYWAVRTRDLDQWRKEKTGPKPKEKKE